IAIYQIIVSGTFTAQQILLAAYLDELGYIEDLGLYSGLILAVFFVFWFLLGPICGSLSDLHGRKFLLIVGNIVSGIAFFGLILSPHPLVLFIMNAALGIGSALRIGSVIALWVQHSPQNRIGESMAYVNIILGIGGIGATVLSFILWAEFGEISFVFFGILLILTAILIVPISDQGDYIPFSLSGAVNNFKDKLGTKFFNNFFLTKPIIQLSIHWLAFSAIISFGTFLIPVINRVSADLPLGIQIPLPVIIFLGIGTFLAILGGLIFWGRISDIWARRPVLIIGFSSTGMLLLMTWFIFQYEQLPILLEGLANQNLAVIGLIGFFIVLLCMATSLIPAPMAWIVDLMGEENVAKAMSLRQALIAIGTIVGTSIGGLIIGLFGISGLILVVFIFLLVSAVILL
ncbi:MAG: MFS transporter, partial [Candidatus Heimdallarchaeota archaeon]|nr:MFS transporter [Candidatus Heimdallarchaeota archaeon]